jgi:hypothetical protein
MFTTKNIFNIILYNFSDEKIIKAVVRSKRKLLKIKSCQFHKFLNRSKGPKFESKFCDSQLRGSLRLKKTSGPLPGRLLKMHTF